MLAALAMANTPQKGSGACIKDSAAMNINWWFEDVNLSDRESSKSGSYPVLQTRCMEVSSIDGVVEGHYISVVVHATLGKTETADTDIIYDPTGPTL